MNATWEEGIICDAAVLLGNILCSPEGALLLKGTHLDHTRVPPQPPPLDPLVHPQPPPLDPL
eukprot:1047509-Prorocentrum_minimum.AAC.1